MNTIQALRQQVGHVVEFNGIKLKVRLAPLDLWVRQGKVPTFFQEQYLKATGGNSTATAVSSEQAAQNGRDEIAFRDQVVRYCLLEPAVAKEDEEAAENEMTMEEIQNIEGLYEFVYGIGIFRGSRAFIPTKGGEIKADDLANFRNEQGQPDSSGAHGTPLQPEAVTASRTFG